MTQRTHRLRRAVRWIARRIGVSTDYHVAWVAAVPGGSATGSMTCTVKPWLHRDNYSDLVAAAQHDGGHAKPPTITSITKL